MREACDGIASEFKKWCHQWKLDNSLFLVQSGLFHSGYAMTAYYELRHFLQTSRNTEGFRELRPMDAYIKLLGYWIKLW